MFREGLRSWTLAPDCQAMRSRPHRSRTRARLARKVPADGPRRGAGMPTSAIARLANKACDHLTIQLDVIAGGCKPDYSVGHSFRSSSSGLPRPLRGSAGFLPLLLGLSF